MRFVFLILVVMILANPSWGQQRELEDGVVPTAWAANALLPEATRDTRVGLEEDTTSSWRYFPLRVGDAREYKTFGHNTYYRREVVGDTLIEGRVYADYRFFRALNGGPMLPHPSVPREFLRFDSLSSLVYGWTKIFGEYNFFEAPCPLNQDFGSTVFCPGTGATASVTGGYDLALVFGGEEPGTGEDTVYTAVKEYDEGAFVFRYAANFGHIYLESDAQFYGLYYSRVNGVEHGVPRYPTVSIEDEISELSTVASLRINPNPFRDRAEVQLNLPHAAVLLVEVFDTVGRRVTVAADGYHRLGSHTVQFDGSDLPSGVYTLRAVVRSGRRSAAQVITQQLTLLK